LEYRQNRVGGLAQVDVYLNGQMVGSAQNAQKKMAQKHAARTALEHLRQQYGAELVRV
jgi:dsRNA-specific ribonuclease